MKNWVRTESFAAFSISLLDTWCLYPVLVSNLVLGDSAGSSFFALRRVATLVKRS